MLSAVILKLTHSITAMHKPQAHYQVQP
uniref:Uncharacterized protein n=1 Tax=Arundo donax TaxID=35708 RepID=A0A0A8YDR0_ARUDO